MKSSTPLATRGSRRGTHPTLVENHPPDRWMLISIAVLALAGAAVGAYISYTHWTDTAIICTGLTSCDYVQQSAYATFGGIPIAALGALLYAGILLSAIVAILRTPWASQAGLALFGMALAGALYSAYLTYLELAVIHAICLWCVVSAIIVATILGLVVWREVRLGRAV